MVKFICNLHIVSTLVLSNFLSLTENAAGAGKAEEVNDAS